MIVGEMITVSVLKGLLDYYTISHTAPANQFWDIFKVYMGLNVYRDFYYLFLSTVLWSALNLGKFRRETTMALLKTAQIEADHSKLKYQFAQAQNAFLKQQINPHLLFNTLNAIYSSIYIKSPEDSKLVLLLSDIMHFSYEDADPRGRVALKNELQQLRNLIELNTFRFLDTVHLDFNIKGDPGEISIIPLVLITLTENIFKHGDLRFAPRSLEIVITPDGYLQYFSKNVPKPKDNYKRNANIGLTNTKLRLEYAYPNNYDLSIEESDDLFTLALRINLAYESDHN